MTKKFAFYVLLIAAVMLAACGPAATPAPEEPQPEAPTQVPAEPTAAPVPTFAFELVAEDDGASAEGAAAVANKLVADPTFVAMAGHAFSGATAAAIPIYESAGIPMLSPSATNPDLTKAGSAVFNRNAFTDVEQAAAAADYIFTVLGFTKLAAMHDGGDYGQGLAQLVADDFTALGGEVVAFEAITPGETDYTAVLSAVAAKSPEVLYFGGYNADGAVIVNQMAQSGLEGVVFFGCDGTFGADFLQKTGANGEGAFSTTLVPASSPEKDAFDAAYMERFGVEPGVLSAYTWNSFDAINALMTVASQVAVVSAEGEPEVCASDPFGCAVVEPGQTVKVGYSGPITGDYAAFGQDMSQAMMVAVDAFPAIEGEGTLYIPRGAMVAGVRSLQEFKGIAGTITCQENGECNASGPVLYVIQDGAWTAVPR